MVMAPDQAKPARQAAIGPAPGRLELVRAFVNTLDIEAGTDELSSPAALTAWLAERELTEAAQSPATETDLRQAVAMREALREMLLNHVQGQHRASGPAGSGGAARVAEMRSVVAGLATRLAVDAATLGTWARLKVCSADDCRWAFNDRSPGRSGCWCSMAVCGSRAKSRAFRRRAAKGG